MKVRVAATTLDDVWFPLLKKKGLNKKPVAAQASMLSDMSARYRLVPRSNQITQAIEVIILPRLFTLTPPFGGFGVGVYRYVVHVHGE